ncbi:Eco57I restriction-modification methylase domain-containing protein [Humibacillus xanthopallidus]|uniref:Eco57I restriction-modification methylase domain-containing protein n=1 Tax=Humibacillus xanthopallidus TaxID=412689 RepID=UPI00384C1A1E
MATKIVVDTVSRIARRDKGRAEAQLQADIYALLTVGALQLNQDDVARLEVPTQDGTRRRLDIELGHCCIEVKKDLRIGSILADARVQLAGYVQTKSQQTGARYVGVITDGVAWHLNHLVADELREVATYTASPDEPDGLVIWLESVLATDEKIPPSPKEIRDRLGADSPAHLLDHATLRALYEASATRPEVAVKRDLWAKLLRTAFGSAFSESPELFIDHTLLVLTAESIAHGVVGFDLTSGQLTPQDIARGSKFQDAQIYGVVEEDFFDWVLDVPGGPGFITELARRIGRFDWSGPLRHDVLKALYTSVLPAKVREALGEYYTPDWLADRMVAECYTDPLNQRLLEPSCGSGTFLLHAVRAHLEAAETAGSTAGAAVASVVSSVIGMDVHPVSVILARVTYLMAIGRDRLNAPDRGPLAIPVYLGDSVQWEQHTDLISANDVITISTAGDDLVSGGGVLFGDDLRFPQSALADAGTFDRLVNAMADKARDASPRSSGDVIAPVLKQFGIHHGERDLLTETFDTMRRLHASGRDHIWGYYVRNLIRPLWLADPKNRVDVLVGNPPWLRYSKMTSAMQARYLVLARQRNLLSGGLGASARDLATLFVVRAVELYLKPGGAFSFVMPHGALSRKPHSNFRSGKWGHKGLVLAASFDQAWDLDKVTTGFPMSSCVVHGRLSAQPVPMPGDVQAWTGKLRNPDVTWQVARKNVTTASGHVVAIDGSAGTAGSAYRSSFRQGAILVPRYLLFVTEESNANPLGAGAGRVSVSSARSPQEKDPWKSHPSISGTVEKRFVRDVLLGESVVPFRVLPARRSVLPVNDARILTRAEVAAEAGLSGWWDRVEKAWEMGRKPSEGLPLLERFDYHQQLSAQLPAATNRVLYSKAGNRLAAARTDDPRALIDHKLYWAAVSGVKEARYLVAILNSDRLLRRVTPLQTKGLFGPRDFDKHIFYVPIPVFDPTNTLHAQIADLAGDAESVACSLLLPPGIGFQTARTLIHEELVRKGLNGQIESAVDQLIGTNT